MHFTYNLDFKLTFLKLYSFPLIISQKICHGNCRGMIKVNVLPLTPASVCTSVKALSWSKRVTKCISPDYHVKMFAPFFRNRAIFILLLDEAKAGFPWSFSNQC